MSTNSNGNAPQFHHQTASVPKSSLLAFWFKQWHGGLLIGAIVIGMFAAGGYIIFLRQRAIADVAGAPLQNGVATVEDKKAVFGQNRITVGQAWYTLVFRLNGKLVIYSETENNWDSVKWAKIKVGQNARVSYRVGKSGNPQIESWEPPSVRP